MKKGIFILSMLSIAFAAVMQAQESKNQQQEPDSIKGVHPYKLEENAKGIKPELAHWSIIPRIGFNAFDGDFTSELKHNVAIPSAGLALEYNFTPVWTVGVEYQYDQYTVTGNSKSELQHNADTLLNGHMHRAGLYLAMDLINLFFPRAQKKIVSLHPYVGAGGAWYKRSAYFMDDKTWGFDRNGNKVLFNPTHARGNTANYINADGNVGPDYDTKYTMEGYIQAGVDLDFNLNRTLALGLRANYTYFTRDYFDGRGYHVGEDSYASKNNDGIFEITANLRFKLEAVSKSHVRNLPSYAAFDKMLADAEPKLIPHDTIIYRFDSIIVREIIRENVKKQPRIFNVYFDNDKDILRQDALATIQEAAEVMESEPDLYAVVIGYCDNTGSKAHNYDLGDRRAKNVFGELAEEFEIPADHMYNAGVGKIAARKSPKSFGPNRRVSIHLVDQETFELMKIQLQDKSEDRNVDESTPVIYDRTNTIRVPKLELPKEEENPVKTVSLEESARKVEDVVAQYAKRRCDTVIVEKGMTFSNLARKYYDNSQCWVFIYMANSDKLTTTSDLKEGMELIIPELTAEELKIEQKDVLRLYSITVHRKLQENKKQ